MKQATIPALIGALLLTGCGFSGIGSGDSGLFPGGGIRGNASEVSGIRFRSRASVLSEDKRSFAVTTRGAGRDMAAAQEAGRIEAVGYCLRTFGGSDIEWAVGPSDTPEALPLGDDGALVLTGRCLTR